MKRILLVFITCSCLLASLCSCTIRSDKMISDKVINDMKSDYEQYLKETYPDETFTVEIWQEYGKDIGSAGLPDYEGYMLKQVITDSKGNRFKIFEQSKGKYSDDYQKVLDGWIRYDENGDYIYTNSDTTREAE